MNTLPTAKQAIIEIEPCFDKPGYDGLLSKLRKLNPKETIDEEMSSEIEKLKQCPLRYRWDGDSQSGE